MGRSPGLRPDLVARHNPWWHDGGVRDSETDRYDSGRDGRARDDITALVDAVMSEDDLVPSVLLGVRQLVQEVAALPPADMAGQTRAMMAAATRAVAGRRGPTEAELSFVEDLAVTRAQQGIPIEVVLEAIHVSERGIWARARELSGELGLDPRRVLDARELYDDWAEAVRRRLIRAHREARSHGRAMDRETEVVRRLLDGGTAAALAAAEAGFPTGSPVWVAVAHGPDALTLLRRASGPRPETWTALLDDGPVSVTARAPQASAVPDGALVGVAGPVTVEEAGTARPLAAAAIGAAAAASRNGLVHAAEVAVPAALLSRTDLAALLIQHHHGAREQLGSQLRPVTSAVHAWLSAGRDTDAAAAASFVHPNTVRNRVQRFSEVTGLDPADPLGAATAWWLCHLWLGEEGSDRPDH